MTDFFINFIWRNICLHLASGSFLYICKRDSNKYLETHFALSSFDDRVPEFERETEKESTLAFNVKIVFVFETIKASFFQQYCQSVGLWSEPMNIQMEKRAETTIEITLHWKIKKF